MDYRRDIRRILAGLYHRAEANGKKYVLDSELERITKFIKNSLKDNSLKLYRYSKADYDNIRNLETGVLYLTPNGVMNDVFECMPSEDIPKLSEWERAELEELVYLKCFSEVNDNPLMWAHYGEASMGMCVEYDLSMLEEDDPVLDHIFPIRYTTSRFLEADYRLIAGTQFMLKLIEYDKVHSIRAIPGDYSDLDDQYLQDITALFLTKGADWSYEHEWRIIIPRVLMSEYANEDPLYENRIVPFNCVTGIYCGTRMKNHVQKHLEEIAERISVKEGRDIIVKRMVMDPVGYQLHVQE